MDNDIKIKIRELLSSIISQITTYYDKDELAFLSFEEKIERTLRDKIAWKLQLKLDELHHIGYLTYKYLVRMEWTPYIDDLKLKKRKVDMAVLRQNNDCTDYIECIAMFEFKAHSLQKPESFVKDEYAKDSQKLRDFSHASELKNANVQPDLYFIFFQQLHLQLIEKYQNACTYLAAINSCFRIPMKKGTTKILNKEEEIEKMHKYWHDIFGCSNQDDYQVYESCLGEYFDHSSYLETVVWNLNTKQTQKNKNLLSE